MSVSNIAAVLQSVLTALSDIPGMKSANVVGDPTRSLDTIEPTNLPFAMIADPELQRSFDPSLRVRDILTLTIFIRADATGLDSSRRLMLWAQLVADVETALVGTDVKVQREGLALDTRLESVKVPGFALGTSSNIVLLQQPVSIRMQPRTYGQPSSQG